MLALYIRIENLPRSGNVVDCRGLGPDCIDYSGGGGFTLENGLALIGALAVAAAAGVFVQRITDSIVLEYRRRKALKQGVA